MYDYYQTPEGQAQLDKEFPLGDEITYKTPRDLSKSNKRALKSKNGFFRIIYRFKNKYQIHFKKIN